MTDVVLFTQPTCGACATQRENNRGVEEAFPAVEFREVDIQSDLETAEEHGVHKTPTTLVYAGDDRVAEFVGVVERDELDGAIRDAQRRESGLVRRLVDYVRG